MHPRVLLNGRKATDTTCALFFVLGFLLHVGIGYIFSTTAVFTITRPVSFVPTCKNCTFVSTDCDDGMAKIAEKGEILSECITPCSSEYLWQKDSSICIPKASLKGYEDHGHCTMLTRRLLENNENEENASSAEKVIHGEVSSLQDVLETQAGSIAFWSTSLLCLTISWALLLKSYTKTMVGGTLLAGGLVLVAVMVLSMVAEMTVVVITTFLLLFLPYIYFMYTNYDRILKSSELLHAAVTSLHAYPSVFGWCILLKCIWLLYTIFSFGAVLKSYFIFNFVISESCTLSGNFPSWLNPARLFYYAQFMWTTAMVQQIRWGTIAGTVGMWYFHHDTPEKLPSSPPRTAFRWACTTSFGTHCLSAIIVAMVRSLYRLSQKNWIMYTNPMGWVILVIMYCLRHIIEALSKYATVVHVLTAESFFASGKLTYGLLKRHFKTGLVSSVISASVLKTFSTLLTFAVCWMSLVHGFGQFDNIDTSEYLDSQTSFLLWLLFIFVSIFPSAAAAVLLLYAISQEDNLSTAASLTIISGLLGAFCNVLCRFMSGIILDAVSATFVCYAIALDNDVHADHTAQVQKCILDSMQKPDENNDTDVKKQKEEPVPLESMAIKDLPTKDAVPQNVGTDEGSSKEPMEETSEGRSTAENINVAKDKIMDIMNAPETQETVDAVKEKAREAAAAMKSRFFK